MPDTTVGNAHRGLDEPLVPRREKGPVKLDGGFIFPNIGTNLTGEPIIVELAFPDTTRVASVALNYSCSQQRVVDDIETRAYFNNLCTELTDLADTYRSAEKLRNFDFGEYAIKCAATDDKEQCTCMTERLRSWKQLQIDFEWADCERFGFAPVDFKKTTADLMDTIVTRKCVSAPCGQGGFCATRDTCNTNLYRFLEGTEDVSQACDSTVGSVGCCEPPCTLAWPYSGLIQPGVCRDLSTDADKGTPFKYGIDNNGRVQHGNEICYPLEPIEHRRHAPHEYSEFYDENGFHDVGVYGCKAGKLSEATHCCAAVGCTTGSDFRRDPIDGLCMDKAACKDHPLNYDKSDTVSQRCNDPSYGVKCCSLEGHFAYSSRELDNPEANQQSAPFRPAFRAEEAGLSAGAGVSSLAASLVALVVLLGATM